MASCDNTVLTGQEGLIQFKPLGTTNCIDDYCPFMGDRIYLPCSADYDIGDCLEVDVVELSQAFLLKSSKVSHTDGGSTVIAEPGDTFYIVDDGKGASRRRRRLRQRHGGCALHQVVSACRRRHCHYLGQQPGWRRSPHRALSSLERLSPLSTVKRVLATHQVSNAGTSDWR